MSVIDTANNSVVDTIDVGDGPRAVAVTPDGERVLVANRGPAGNDGNDTVSVIRSSDGAVIDTLTVGDQPAGIAVTADGSVAYVSNAGAVDSVSPIDLGTLTPGTAIPVGDDPRQIVFTPDGSTAFVSNIMPNSPGTVSVIDVATGTGRQPDHRRHRPGRLGDHRRRRHGLRRQPGQQHASRSSTPRAERSRRLPDVGSPFDLALGPCLNLPTPTPDRLPGAQSDSDPPRLRGRLRSATARWRSTSSIAGSTSPSATPPWRAARYSTAAATDRWR